MLASFFNWAKANNLADNWSDIAGFVITIVGFGATLIGVLRVRRAAVSAREAAEQTRDSIRLLDTVQDFSAAITTLDEIKRLHRQPDPWVLLPDRYAAIRKQLIALRASHIRLDEAQLAIVQGAIQNLTQIERLVDKMVDGAAPPKRDRLNVLISNDIDGLIQVLEALKAQRIGGV